MSSPTPTPLFVCPGARPVPLGYAIMTIGDGIEHMQSCPRREKCAWFAGHDLGASVLVDDFPPAAQLQPAFSAENPHVCPRFEQLGGRAHHRARSRIADPAAQCFATAH